MSRKEENTSFTCIHCGQQIKSLKNGSYRNHCPYCLYSLHLDIKIGDRANDCKGVMKPIGVKSHKKKGLQIIHECTVCG